MGLTQKLGTIPLAIFTDTSNNVGIGGAPSGSYKLDVTGTGRFTSKLTIGSLDGESLKLQEATSTGNNYLRFYSSAGSGLGYIGSFNNAGTQYLLVDGSGTDLSLNGNANLLLRTGGTERMRINSSGNVGIGTSSQSDRLNVVVGSNGNNTRFDGPTSGLIIQTNASSADIIAYGGTTPAYRALNFSTSASTNMTITTAGNVGINGTPTSYSTNVYFDVIGNSTNQGGIIQTRNSDNSVIGSFFTNVNGLNIRTETSHPMLFSTAGSERMRITSGGYVGIGSVGAYLLDVRGNISGDWCFNLQNSNSSSVVYGMIHQFNGGSAMNNSSSYYYYAGDSAAQRCSIRGNGGIYNFQANDSNLSDIRTKKDIHLLESYWDKFKAIEIVKFKYKDQQHDDYNIGVIAQQIEKVAPEFVDTDYWDNPTSNDKTEMKSVFTTDLYHATIKVLQEAMTKIEILEAEIEELKSLINK